jgi:Response regulator of the LytR/AlgR family
MDRKLNKSWWSALLSVFAPHRGQRRSLGVAESDNQADPLAIMLTGQTKESLSVRPENILYIEADGNYVNVCYLLDAEVTSKLLRSPIKQMETMLQDRPHFIRCHRTFIVNAHQVSHVKRSAQGYQLCLRHTQTKISVSRSYVKDFNSSFGFSPKLF